MREHRISLARDFSRDIGPRYVEQGPYSGQKFRKVLVKALKEHQNILVDLDGTTGIGSSFLDEAFGGLVSKEGFLKSDIKRRVRVKSDLDESYLSIVSEAIDMAKPTDKVGFLQAHMS